MKRIWKELVVVVVSLLLAVGVIVAVKFVFLPKGTMLPTREGVFALECAVVLAFLGAFFLNEIYHGMAVIRRFLKGGGEHGTAISVRPVLVMLLGFAGSLIVYLAFVRLG